MAAKSDAVWEGETAAGLSGGETGIISPPKQASAGSAVRAATASSIAASALPVSVSEGSEVYLSRVALHVCCPAAAASSAYPTTRGATDEAETPSRRVAENARGRVVLSDSRNVTDVGDCSSERRDDFEAG
jgi:hypothetical protein